MARLHDQPLRQLEIQLGHFCNNRCVFCVSGQVSGLGLAQPIPLDPVVAALEEATARGVTTVTFLGGEPTLQKSFLPALRRAVELGFRDIIIFTNGVRTPSRSFIDEVAGIARVTWRFSIQGGNEEAHDRVTQKKGSFARIVKGLTYLKEIGAPVTANACINEYSYRSLPDYPALIARHGVRQLHLDMVRPSDAGNRTDDYLREIMPRYSDMAPYFRRMLEEFERLDPDFDVNVGNYPYCLLPEWNHKIHHDGEPTSTLSADGGGQLSSPWNKYQHQRSDKFHPSQCEPCVFKPECRGISDKYASFYGTAEFQPVTLERLREIDTRQHRFVLLVEPFLAPLLAARPPEGWAAAELSRRTRDRLVEMRYRHGGAGTVSLIFTPPAGVGKPVAAPAPVFVTQHYRMGVSSDAGIDARAAAALTHWAGGVLATAPGIEVDRRVDVEHVMAVLADRSGLARLARYVRKIRGRREFGRWRYAGARSMDHGTGLIIALEAPGGGRIELALEAPGDGGRSLARLQLGDGVDAGEARAVVSDLVTTLRASPSGRDR
jgi:MoaA/NifB/PqqE/SkfB family radical SAM enzyme